MFRKKWAIVLLAFFVLMVDSSYAKSEIKNNSVSDVRQSKNAASIWEDLWKWKFSIGLAIFLIVSTWSYASMTFSKQAVMLQKFPSVWKFPFIGSVPFLVHRPEALPFALSRAIETFGRRFVLWIGSKPYVMIVDAEGTQKILSSTKYIEKGLDYKKVKWLLGEGLVTSNGHVWREDRKLLSPAFKYQSFDGFLAHFNNHSKILTEILRDKLTPGKGQDLHPFLCGATMDFITESALGQSSNYQRDISGKFFTSVKIPDKLMAKSSTFLNHFKILGIHLKDLDGRLVQQLINKRKAILAQSEEEIEADGKTRPFIDSIIKTKSNKDITAHILTIFGAGFETTASGMNHTLFLLAENEECQRKVHEELDAVLKTGGDITFADLAELKYLEMCIKESLRVLPPVPMIMRHATEDIPLDNSQIIPKGCEMVFIIREIHRDPQYFPNPDQFDPNRFLPEACVNRNQYAFIPFSAGPRNCLGMKYAMIQMKTCLAHILRNFRVSTTQKRKDMKIVYGMVLEAMPHIEVTISPRN
ncbi:Cytochrome P450 4C1 [Folsomia candida]|uniref:Cytochrome P450 4C1 n=1 Tax=Folsomia candida TaxID=158441 RepID=A0A226CYH0_FOLCA|nr:Cytochrome P450 4C1 [Folsomia candida]